MSKRCNELRWNPLLGCWVVVSSSRATRPWREPGKCPFCPGAEETGYGWNVLVLDNRFPALKPDAEACSESRGLYKVRPAYGYAKVVIETPEHEGDLDTIPFANLVMYLKLLAQITELYCRDRDIAYVFPFRNKGEVIGVSLTHPHSQVYVMPFVPPRVEREYRMMAEHRRGGGGCLLCEVLEQEEREGTRLIYSNSMFTAFLPFYAMWPYEVHVYPRQHLERLDELGEEGLEELADALRVVVATYNELFGFSLPYMMVLHQKPCRGYDGFHMHVEFYPVHRSPDKLKYPAGIEWGAWVFTYDAVPEEKAEELRAAAKRALEKLKGTDVAPKGGLRGGNT